MDGLKILAETFLTKEETPLFMQGIESAESDHLIKLQNTLENKISEQINLLANGEKYAKKTDDSKRKMTTLEWLKSTPIYETLCRLFRRFFFLANFCPHAKLAKVLYDRTGCNGTVYKIPGDGNCMLYAMNTLLLAKSKNKSMADFTYGDFTEVCNMAAENRKVLAQQQSNVKRGQFGTCLCAQDLAPCAKAIGRDIPIIYFDSQIPDTEMYYLCTKEGTCQISTTREFDLDRFKEAAKEIGGALLLVDHHARCYVGDVENIIPIFYEPDSAQNITDDEEDDMMFISMERAEKVKSNRDPDAGNS
ncbi:MAG: hypothetical protein LBT98_02525 [Puniceicoccales bacterium]|nr:hypothetical protein [Puniceicoccales bacterium]